ncbi:hypothetical protein Dxin01_04216 [Deinococcus xinjiangensis]|uniref:AAA+ ATPase domain-containing protein n=1 Tax=Deinococcus xinjiangensis TaxID=457454 RepID=A0ABP9VI57_9DEIO
MTATTQPQGETAPTEHGLLHFAQRRLEQARENDRATRPQPHAGMSLEELLSKAAAKPQRRIYPTAAHVDALARVKSVPQFMAAIHAAYCTAGSITIQDQSGEIVYARCPRCEKTQREQALRVQMLASGIEGRYLDVEWADLELLAPLDRVAEKCTNITALIEGGASLLLFGQQTGSGKTQAAMLIAKAAIRAGYTAHVRNLARLALDVRESYRDKSAEQMTEKAALLSLTTPDLLVIDDLGAGESDTAAVERRLLFLALDERQMQRRPTIVTTNLLLTRPEDEKRKKDEAPTLVELMGARVLARLQPLKALHVNHGTNFRTRQSDVSW